MAAPSRSFLLRAARAAAPLAVRFRRGITNNEMPPLALLCRLTLFVEVGELWSTDFHAARLALINALVAAVASRSRSRALARLMQLDGFAAARSDLVPGPTHVAAPSR